MGFTPGLPQKWVNIQPALTQFQLQPIAPLQLFAEYAGTFLHHDRPQHGLDAGATWRVTNREQVDLSAGFGLNSSSIDHFVVFGYSFRLDSLW
jgi:hypothetical protein